MQTGFANLWSLYIVQHPNGMAFKYWFKLPSTDATEFSCIWSAILLLHERYLSENPSSLPWQFLRNLEFFLNDTNQHSRVPFPRERRNVLYTKLVSHKSILSKWVWMLLLQKILHRGRNFHSSFHFQWFCVDSNKENTLCSLIVKSLFACPLPQSKIV